MSVGSGFTATVLDTVSVFCSFCVGSWALFLDSLSSLLSVEEVVSMVVLLDSLVAELASSTFVVIVISAARGEGSDAEDEVASADAELWEEDGDDDESEGFSEVALATKDLELEDSESAAVEVDSEGSDDDVFDAGSEG